MTKTTRVFLLLVLLLTGCSSGLKLVDYNPYQEKIDEYGHPDWIWGDGELKSIFGSDDLYWIRQPPNSVEIWGWYSIKEVWPIEWYPKTSFCWITPDAKAGDLEICAIDTCWQEKELCLEIKVDGLTYDPQHKSLGRIDLILGERKWRKIKEYVLWTSLPVKGSTRAFGFTAWIPDKWLNKAEWIKVKVTDLLTQEMREGVIEL